MGQDMEPSESELISRVCQGDDDAFAQLLLPYVDRAFRLAMHRLRNSEEAEDAVQEAMVKAWRGLKHFRGQSSFSTWFFRILWRTCSDRLRRVQPIPMQFEPPQISSEGDPQSRWDLENIEEALKRISAPYQTVLVLHYVEDLPVKEIALILELPLGTVKTRLHRARKALRRVMSTHEN